MTIDIADLPTRVAAAAAAATSLDEIQRVSTEFLGKRSAIAEAKKSLGALDPDARRTVGQQLNEVRAAIEAVLDARRADLASGARAAQLEAERLDLTEVRERTRLGHLHLVTQARDRLEDLFVGMGFTVLAYLNRNADPEPTAATSPAAWVMQPMAGGPQITLQFDQESGWTRVTDSRSPEREWFFHDGRALLPVESAAFPEFGAAFLSAPVESVFPAGMTFDPVELGKLLREAEAEIIEARDLKRVRDAAEARIQELEAERLMQSRAGALSPILGVDDPAAAFLEASLDLRRQTIDALATITLLPQPRGRKGFRTESVVVDWR